MLEKINNLLKKGDEGPPKFVAITYDKKDHNYNVRLLPVTIDVFWTTTDLEITLDEEKNGAEQKHEVKPSKLHELEGNLDGFDSEYVSIWDKNDKEAKTWENTARTKAFNGKHLYVQSHEDTVIESLKSMFQNVGLGGSEFGAFFYIMIIIAVCVVGGYFLLTRLTGFSLANIGLVGLLGVLISV